MKKSEVKLKVYSKSGNTYGLTEKLSPSRSPQLLPIMVPSIGFICKGNKILNFYAWDVDGFKTFPSGNESVRESYKEFLKFTKLKDK